MKIVRPHLYMTAAASLLVGCRDPLTTQPTDSVTWTANNVQGYVETAKGDPDSAYAWGLVVEGGIARWRECTSASRCTGIERTRPASEVLATEHVGRAPAPDGTEVDVLRLSLTPRRKYVVPATSR